MRGAGAGAAKSIDSPALTTTTTTTTARKRSLVDQHDYPRSESDIAAIETALVDAEALDENLDVLTKNKNWSMANSSSTGRRGQRISFEAFGRRNPSAAGVSWSGSGEEGVEMKNLASSANSATEKNLTENEVGTYIKELQRFARSATRLETVESWKYHVAAQLTRGLMRGTTFDIHKFRDDILYFGQSSCMRRVRYHLLSVKGLVRIAVVVHMLLALYEPTWVNSHRCHGLIHQAANGSIIKETSAVIQASSTARGCFREDLLIPFWSFALIESTCVAILWVRNFAELQLQSRLWWRRISRVSTIAMTLDVILFYFLDLNTPRFSRFLRPIMLFSTSRLFRYVTSSFVRTLPRIADVLLLSFIFILFYAILGMSIFTDTKTLELVHNASYFEDFTSIERALMLVLDIGTTENIPSVIYPYINQHPLIAFLYISSFTFIFLWLILPLFLSATFETYCSLQRYMLLKRSSRNQAIQILLYSTLCLKSDSDTTNGDYASDSEGIDYEGWIKYCGALKFLGNDETVPRRIWNALIVQQGNLKLTRSDNSKPEESRISKSLPSEDSKMLFGSARLHVSQFRKGVVLAALQGGKSLTKGASWAQRIFTCLFKPCERNFKIRISSRTYQIFCCCLSKSMSERCASLVKSNFFYWCSSIINLGSVLILVFFSVPNRHDSSVGSQLYWWNFGFVIAVFLEAVVRIIAVPAEKSENTVITLEKNTEFFSEYLDAFWAFLAVCVELYYIPMASIRALAITSESHMLLGLTRAVRVVRLVRLHNGSLKYLSRILRIMGVLGLYLVLYAAITYSFAVLAVELFAGNIKNPAFDGDYSYLQEQHAACDTFQQAYIILFQLTTQNNWNEVNATHAEASGQWVWFFFGSYIFLVSIVFQDIITGVVIDAFEHVHSAVERNDMFEDGEQVVVTDTSNNTAQGVSAEPHVHQKMMKQAHHMRMVTTRFDEWFGNRADEVSEEESKEAMAYHAGVLREKLTGVRARLLQRRSLMSLHMRTSKQQSLPPENVVNPLDPDT